MRTFLNFLMISFLLFLSSERQHLCSLVEDYVVIPYGIEGDRYNNGYKEERYHFVLDEFIAEFTPDIQKRLGTFHILRDWFDGSVNAWAWRQGSEFWLEVPGGMARYGLINEEAFLLTLCHELGHLLGGSPQRNDISYEGQSDYFATMKCMERILAKLNQGRALSQKALTQDLRCSGVYCIERFRGIESLVSYYADIEKSPVPSLMTPSALQVQKTLRSHPKAQCRFDTMVAALRCDNRLDFSNKNPWNGACLRGESARPRCWFNPKEFLGHN